MTIVDGGGFSESVVALSKLQVLQYSNRSNTNNRLFALPRVISIQSLVPVFCTVNVCIVVLLPVVIRPHTLQSHKIKPEVIESSLL